MNLKTRNFNRLWTDKLAYGYATKDDLKSKTPALFRVWGFQNPLGNDLTESPIESFYSFVIYRKFFSVRREKRHYTYPTILHWKYC